MMNPHWTGVLWDMKAPLSLFRFCDYLQLRFHKHKNMNTHARCVYSSETWHLKKNQSPAEHVFLAQMSGRYREARAPGTKTQPDCHPEESRGKNHIEKSPYRHLIKASVSIIGWILRYNSSGCKSKVSFRSCSAHVTVSSHHIREDSSLFSDTSSFI